MKVSTKQKAFNYLEEKKAFYKIKHTKDRAEHGEMSFSPQDDEFNRRTQQLIHYTVTKKYSQDIDISAECIKILTIINRS